MDVMAFRRCIFKRADDYGTNNKVKNNTVGGASRRSHGDKTLSVIECPSVPSGAGFLIDSHQVVTVGQRRVKADRKQKRRRRPQHAVYRFGRFRGRHHYPSNRYLFSATNARTMTSKISDSLYNNIIIIIIIVVLK